MPSCDSFVFDEMKLSVLVSAGAAFLQAAVLVTDMQQQYFLMVENLFYFSTELPDGYVEEEFNTPVAQDPDDLTEDTRVAVTEAGDVEWECAGEKQ